mgnify:CR=1 FL=1
MTADDLTRIAVTGSAVRTAEEPLLAAGRGPELMRAAADLGPHDPACAPGYSGARARPRLATGRLLGRRSVPADASAHFATRIPGYRS